IDLSSTNVVPIIVNSRTMVPLRFVVETLGAAITWNDSAKVITITYQKQ
ncbi:copper amine oxidase N-terminal domain-containing protein, partial [Coprothermobacter proteolyticus]|nr:copper amine oxidase N-terminal domain-containing protein [Coprothermobacter proteolyticus]